MIGHFTFMAGAPEGHVVLHLGWQEDRPVARVSAPLNVAEQLRDQAINVRDEDDYMTLPIALSYAVLLSGLSQAGLIVSGDRSAWPFEWGQLIDMHPYAVARARSH